MKLSFFILSILLILVALMHANFADASQAKTKAQSAGRAAVTSFQPVAQQP